jgi:uncharacterized protein
MTSQAPVVDWLSHGGPWRQVPEVVETHAAMVFLVGDRAFKLKKAVDLGYLDFTTPQRRRAVLERELFLNRRTAPSIYLRVVPVVRLAGGEFSLGGEGETIDWLLEMRRFPSEALLSRMADRGALDEATIEGLAAHIARFHECEPVVDAYDWPAAVARIAKENTDDLRAQVGSFDAVEVAAVAAARDAAISGHAALLVRQSASVRHCHGDLHLGNAFVDGEQPTLFDCIEFDDFYATIPPLYDLAFLLMDLLARRLPRLANRTLNAWIIHRDREQWREIMESLAALPLYLALRAEIRAKTEGRRPGGVLAARGYLTLAKACFVPGVPRLIAVGGLSGTGKSTLAKHIAWRCGGPAGAIHLRSDELRKRIAGIPLGDRLPERAYTPETSNEVYAALFDLAERALRSGQAVILDAVFAREAERTHAATMVAGLGVVFDGLWLEAPAETLERRVSGRRCDASDADVAVLRKQLSYDLGRIDWHRMDASATEAQTVEAALRHLNLR